MYLDVEITPVCVLVMFSNGAPIDSALSSNSLDEDSQQSLQFSKHCALCMRLARQYLAT